MIVSAWQHITPPENVLSDNTKDYRSISRYNTRTNADMTNHD